MENNNIENLFGTDETYNNNAFSEYGSVSPVNYEETNDDSLESSETKEEVQEQITEEAEEKIVEEVKPESTLEEEPLSYNVFGNESVLADEPKTLENNEVLENPNAQIKLQNEVEEQISNKEIEELKGVKLKDNSSLMFVLVLGLIFMAAIFLIPYLATLI